MIAALVGARRRMRTLPSPDLCADARAWASTQFRVIAPRTRQFEAALTPGLILMTAEGPGTLEAEIGQLLGKYESPSERLRSRDLGGPRLVPPAAGVPTWVAILKSLGMRAR
jgi:hypothetical protein